MPKGELDQSFDKVFIIFENEAKVIHRFYIFLLNWIKDLIYLA